MGAPYRIYNIGNHRSESLLRFIEVIEKAVGRQIEKVMEPMQAGDVKETFADVEAIRTDFGFQPKTPIEEGIPKFVSWYRDFYQV